MSHPDGFEVVIECEVGSQLLRSLVPFLVAGHLFNIIIVVVVVFIIMIIIVFFISIMLLFTALRKTLRSGLVDFATLLFSSKHICLWGLTFMIVMMMLLMMILMMIVMMMIICL